MNKRRPSDYGPFLKDVVGRVDAYLASAEKTEAAQIELYWSIGEAICARTERSAAVVLSEELARVFPEETGFSPRNVRRMREFYRSYAQSPAITAVAFKIGWTSNVLIMEHCASQEEREAYLYAVKRTGWSKAELLRSFDNPDLLKEPVAALTSAGKAGKQPLYAKREVSGDSASDTVNTLCVAPVPPCEAAAAKLSQERGPQHEKDNRWSDKSKTHHASDTTKLVKTVPAGETRKGSLSAKGAVSGDSTPDIVNAPRAAPVLLCGPVISALPRSHRQGRILQQQDKGVRGPTALRAEAQIIGAKHYSLGFLPLNSQRKVEPGASTLSLPNVFSCGKIQCQKIEYPYQDWSWLPMRSFSSVAAAGWGSRTVRPDISHNNQENLSLRGRERMLSHIDFHAPHNAWCSVKTVGHDNQSYSSKRHEVEPNHMPGIFKDSLASN